MKSERFALLECAHFYNLFELRYGPDHGGRDAGKSVFQDIRDCERTNTRITTKARRKIPENFVFFVPSW